jgi:hypothetical protein
MNARTFALALTLTLAGAPAIAQPVPGARYIPYKGHLERDGAPLSGSLPFTFALYSAAQGGAPIWSGSQDLDVAGGEFSANIGPVPEAALEQAELYLAITVDGTALVGRQRIQSAPYAVRGQRGVPFRADSVVITGAQLGPPVTLTAEADGSLTASGAIYVGGANTVGLLGNGFLVTPRGRSREIIPLRRYTDGASSITFTYGGGRALFIVNATAWSTTGGTMRVRVDLNGAQLGDLRGYAPANMHLPMSRVLHTAGLFGPGQFVLTLTPDATFNTVMDVNDWISVTMIELPF